MVEALGGRQLIRHLATEFTLRRAIVMMARDPEQSP
jgi:hypothetical protein